MGRWGTGLWENDGALDRVADLIPRVEKSRGAEDLAARVGLTLWLAPAALGALVEEEELFDQVKRFDLAGLQAPVRARLRALARATPDDLPRVAPSAELARALGAAVTGERESLLVDLPHARRLAHEMLDRCSPMLDEAGEGDLDQVFEEFAPLGLLALLGERVERGRVNRWRTAFDEADQATSTDRAHWDEAVERVRPLFNLVATPE